MTVLIVVMIVPIVVFGLTFFITASVTRHDTQARNMKALYLAQAGIHQALFNIKSTGTPLPVPHWDANNQIAVTVVAQCSNVYQLKSVGTSIAAGNSVSRTVFAEVYPASSQFSIYREGDGTGIPPPVCCDPISWSFSEGSGNTTGTAPYVGTLVNSPPWVAGRVGTALSFNTTPAHRYVTVPHTAGLNFTTAGTLMAWIYNTAQVNTGTGIVHKGALSSQADEAYGIGIRRNGGNRRLQLVLRDAGGTRRTLNGGTNLSLNTWYHVVATWGADGLSLYLNGGPLANNSTVRVARTTTGALQIGTLVTNSATTRFIGTVDEVYAYPCEKTAAEIKAYYNSTCAGSGATPCPRP